MNIQETNQCSPVRSRHLDNNIRNLKLEPRRYPRYKIKRKVLLKEADGRVYLGLACDISRLGLHLQCTSQVAYELLYSNRSSPDNPQTCEIKISLPYMNRLTECWILCKIASHKQLNLHYTRIGLYFQLIDKDNQVSLDHFLNNLTR